MRKDLWYALRNMAANPGVYGVALLTLALGIGVNTAMFSVMHAVLLRPLPYRDADRLVTIGARIPRLNIWSAAVEYNTFAEWWRARARSFEAMAAHTSGWTVLTLGDQPQRVRTVRVTANYFSVIGLGPSLGRDFLPEEDQPGGPRVAILSDGLWKRRFGANRAVLGQSILLDQNSYTVIGVLSPGFELNQGEVFVPIAASTARAPGQPTVGAYARLKPGVTVREAQAEIDGLCRGWVAEYQYPKDWGAQIWRLRDYLVREVRSSILVLAVAVALVLLIACSNVANLLLARAGARQREIAIRSALGADRGRILRQLLTESALLGGLAAGLGLLLAWSLGKAIVASEVPLPFLRSISVDGTILAFTVGASLVTTVLFGLAPALAAAHAGLLENLKEGGRGGGEGVRRSRFRSTLVVAEVALALLLVIGATLTIRSLVRLQAVDPGFNPESVLTADLALPRSGYAEAARRAVFYRTLLERVAAIPGVASASMASHLPFSGSKSGNDIFAEGAPPPKPGEQTIAFHRTIDAGYFRALQVPLKGGRFFTARDSSGPPIAIVNETLARRFWPGQDAAGKRFKVGRSGPVFTVVGVTADMRNTSLADPPDLEYYLPYSMSPPSAMALVIRTTLDPLRLASSLRAAVRELDKDLPVSDLGTLEANIARSTGARRFSVTLLAGFALLALLLASVGIYGVVSYSVARRRHEIGVRMALGAARSRIASMVVGNAVLLGGAGVAIGIMGSFGLTRLIRTMLYGVSATDPLVFAAAAVFLLGISALAAYIPARRAAAVDPLIALRDE